MRAESEMSNYYDTITCNNDMLTLQTTASIDEHPHFIKKGVQMIDDYSQETNKLDNESSSTHNHRNLSLLASYDSDDGYNSTSQKYFGMTNTGGNFDEDFDRDFDEDNEERHTHMLGTPRTIKRQYFSLEALPRQREINDNFLLEHVGDIKHLCDGSHSNIYKGSFQDKAVILKVLLDKDVRNIIANKEFQNEIIVLSKMNHPHILQIIGFGKMDSKLIPTLSRPLIVLEALEGETLKHHLSLRRSFRTKPFSKIRYLRMAKEFASALTYIHDQIDPNCTLIHRDLKPDNIGFMKDGTLKLMDFGLSVGLKKGTSVEGTYKLTGCTGSLRYMAPEVALSKPYNEKVDIYGFGMIFYQIITGVMPFQGYTQEKFYLSVVNGKYRPSLDFDDYGRDIKISDTLRNLIISCWDDDHTTRPSASTVHEILELLECNKSNQHAKRSVLRKSIDKVASIFSKQDTI